MRENGYMDEVEERVRWQKFQDWKRARSVTEVRTGGACRNPVKQECIMELARKSKVKWIGVVARREAEQ